MRTAGASSPVWRFTMAFTGVGSTMLGPFMPQLLAKWRLHDHQGGMLVACLFLGSFSGTLLLSNRLDRSLRWGAWAAAVGCAGLGVSTYFGSGFVGGLTCLLVMGFGMGQLMSSINLLVGAAPAPIRSSALANLGAAWCIGAVLSPALSTVVVRAVSSSTRVLLFAPLFLLPLVCLPDFVGDSKSPQNKVGLKDYLSSGVVVCALTFLVYGGIEASISAWITVFATRYSVSPMAIAQGILSLFWAGLIVGRLLTAMIASPVREPLLLRAAIIGSLACLTWLLIWPSLIALLLGSTLMGICLSPLFPLLLSITLSYGYPTRVMGGILAACALGSAVFPALLGVLSSMFSLRAGMLLPVLGLMLLLLFRSASPRHEEAHP
jgi:MFS transporter, FHS family, glucose/mannose:H+ symporter